MTNPTRKSATLSPTSDTQSSGSDTQSSGQPVNSPQILAENLEIQRPKVTKGWISRYGLAYFGSCVGWAGPSQLLLGNQLMLMRPDDKETALSLIMMLGGAAMVVTSLVTGLLSDRTRSKWGRRMPWVLAGSTLCSLCLVYAPTAPNFLLLVIMWGVFQVSMAFVTNNLLTIGPDVAPPSQYGTISGVLGASYTLGLVAGTVLASSLNIKSAYWAIAFVLIVTTVQMRFGSALRVILHAERQAFEPHDVFDLTPAEFRLSHPTEDTALSADPSTTGSPTAAHSLTVTHSPSVDSPSADSPSAHSPSADSPSSADARSYRDYWWIFGSRFVIHLGNFTALFYLLFYLADHLKVSDPNGGVMMLTIIFAGCTVATSIISGSLSDRMGKRKIFVILSASAIAVATLLMAFAQNMITVIIAAIILGLAWGVFSSVDQALINEALPSEKNRSRDISIMTLTVGISNMIAGGVAALALHHLGGYPGLYGLCAAVSLIGTLLVIPVRSSS
ncbi:major facilitator superfamily permease [Corynebacterium resistens DSM 45100]|uniref:Major facilitator superfamily permease n=1 Tax=Corynebacterium resistens (strain DSM 45100 / JCM 12819 / GTC 2026 / SICGH 158) TaxID=662755 RepID=F8E3B4_CORRG|nr:MFS transporter [Corynebacterium resistens]AEI10440.1 major facilitator superfamily permease [Corynebacterium resistens DSM 45100]